MAAGEFDFIDWIRSQQHSTPLVPVPAGDDLAVVRWAGEDLLLLGVDQVLDGVHFDSHTHTPRQIGRKVMNRNLSDCAAMACLPAVAVATVALPRTAGIEYARELYLGLRDAAEAFDCQIVGGDTASWDGPLAMTVSILGRSAGIQPITRSGAKPDQLICVTGPLGGSLIGRHMDFVPRIALARELAASGWITAMIDISDGLSRDLWHIAQQSRVGAVIDAAHVPIHQDALRRSQQDGRPPLEHALHDGEDHELLITMSRAPSNGVIPIGRTTAEPGIFLAYPDGRREPLEPRGWEHAL
jgi:thiamine-monophosphate kinase